MAIRFRLLPLSIGLIVAATALPVEVDLPRALSLDFQIEPSDVLANLVLYAPLGIAMRGQRGLQVFVRACALSMAIEGCQLFFGGRYASPVDVLVNGAGAVSGRWVGRMAIATFKRSAREVALTRSMATVVLAITVIILIAAGVLSQEPVRGDFSNWDSTFDLAVGDELTGDRAWEGRLLEFAAFAAPIESDVLWRLTGQGPGSIAANKRAFPDEPLFQLGPVADLAVIRGVPLLSQSQAATLFEVLTKRGTLTLLAWCTITDPDQTGPARILTYSRDPFHRNFTLGQERRAIHFRLRTPVTGPNGTDHEIKTQPIFTKNADVLLAATYDGYVARVYADGRLVGRQNLAAASYLIPSLWDTSLPVFAAVLAAFAAVGGLGISQARAGFISLTVGGSCGAIIGLALLLTGMGSASPAFEFWLVPLGLAAGLVVGRSAIPAEIRSPKAREPNVAPHK